MEKITRSAIKNFILAHKELLLQCALAVVLYVIVSYKLDDSTMPILLDDEFGYWSNSFYITGINQTSIMQNIAYYSYGYSLILTAVRFAAELLGYSNWYDVYGLACTLNILFIVCGFFIAVRLCRRYMHNLNWLTRSFVCFAAMLYPASFFYSHITLTECAITMMFWVFLYTMMRVVDKPGVLNHIAFAAVSVYAYTIHQRAVSMLITAVVTVVLVKTLRISKTRHTAAFFGTGYLCLLLHSVMKKNLQNVLYLGQPKADLAELVSYALTKKAAVMLTAVILTLLLLYLLEKRHVRLVCVVVAAGAAIVAVYALKNGFSAGSEPAADRIAVNDFSGQWGKIVGIFSRNGLIRLGTSIVGKWFYLAAATGLVICWGMRGLIVNAFWVTVDIVRKACNAVRGKESRTLKWLKAGDYKEYLWLLGVFLAWIGAFMICAIYKEGLYKVDDLVHGRYIEYVIGIVIIYSMDRLLADRHWFIMLAVCLALYLAAGSYCQYVYDILQRTEFELAHAVVLGRIFWNYESPTGKVRELAGYVVPLSVSFILMLKLFDRRILKYKLNVQIAAARCIAALMLPAFVWTHISYEIIDNYVCVRNEKQSGAAPEIATRADMLESGENIYFVHDWLSYKQASLIQFMLQDKVLEYTSFSELSFDEDAIYIISNKMLEDPKVKEKCEIVCQRGSYALAINKNQEIMKRWNLYKNSLQL